MPPQVRHTILFSSSNTSSSSSDSPAHRNSQCIRAQRPHSMMMHSFRLLLHRRPAQKIVFLLLFFHIARALGVIALHFHALFVSELRQVANEPRQLPTVLFRSMRAAKRRHAREAHAIFNNPENFAVGELLRLLQAQVRRLRIYIAADHSISTSVVGVADGAVIGKVQASVT